MAKQSFVYGFFQSVLIAGFSGVFATGLELSINVYFSSTFISPFTVKKVWTGSVFAVIVTLLLCFPFFPFELKTTFISPCSPGAIGAFGHWGTVHPQLPFAFLISRGSFPVLVKTKT